MAAGNLYGVDLTPTSSSGSVDARTDGDPRIERADRLQLRLESRNLDDLVAHDHRVRALWDAVGGLDLSAFYERIRARGTSPGRPAIDPRVLITLWLYATSEGVGSARRLARLSEQHDVYRWVCGGITVCHRVLSDFRVGHGKALDGLLTQLLAVLMQAGVVKLKRVAQDGTRVRASAGAASFRRERSLKRGRSSRLRPATHGARIQLDAKLRDRAWTTGLTRAWDRRRPQLFV